MGFLNNLKKKVKLKESQVSSKTIQQSKEKIPKLEKDLQNNPDNYDMYYQLYCCYVDLSNPQKKIECLEQMHMIKPKDTFPLTQLSHIYYLELKNPEKGKYYQNKANKINSSKFL